MGKRYSFLIKNLAHVIIPGISSQRNLEASRFVSQLGCSCGKKLAVLMNCVTNNVNEFNKNLTSSRGLEQREEPKVQNRTAGCD